MSGELVLGGSGLLGAALLAAAARDGVRAVGTSYSQSVPGLRQVNIQDQAQLRRLFEGVRPEVVYAPVANPNVEAIERDPSTRNLNVEAILQAAHLAQKLGARFVFYSSDYVFDGVNGPYRETDLPAPINEYGRQKLEVEKALETMSDCLVLRVTVVFGWQRQPKNFAQRTVMTLREGKPLVVPNDQLGSPSYAPNVAEASRELALNGRRGLYHLAGVDVISRYDFARALARGFGLPADLISPAKTSELGQLARRPLQAGMHVDKATRHLDRVRLLGHEQAIQRMRKEEPT